MKKNNLMFFIIFAFLIIFTTFLTQIYNRLYLGIAIEIILFVGFGFYLFKNTTFSSTMKLNEVKDKIFPLWSSQIDISVSETERHLMNIALNLDNMIEEIKKIKSEAFLSNANGSNVNIFENSKQKLQTIADDLKNSIDDKNMLVEEVEVVAKSLDEIDNFIDTIASFSMQIRVLSTNALIIAAKIAGEHGNSFAVVADEMGQFSNKVDTITERLDKIIGNFKSTYTKNQDMIKNKILDDIQTVNNLDMSIKDTIDKLYNFSNNVINTKNLLETSTINMDKDIRESLYNLQFQDRISQILTNVKNEIRNLSTHIDTDSKIDIENFVEMMKKNYTTSEELKQFENSTKIEKDNKSINNGEIVFF